MLFHISIDGLFLTNVLSIDSQKKKKKFIVYKSLYNILQKKLNTEKNQRPIELLWTIIEDNICPHQKMLSTFQNTRDSR